MTARHRARPRLRSRCVRVPGLAAVLWVCALPAVTAAQTIRDPRVASLEFEGNETFPDSELYAAIETQPTRCRTFLLSWLCALTDWGFAHRRGYLADQGVVRDRLRLEGFYRFRGFLQARVDTAVDREDERVRVRFDIEEGPATPIDSLTISGLPGAMPLNAARRRVSLGAGDRFDQVRLEAGKDSLVHGLRELGYIDALVLQDALIPRGEGGARVRLDVSPGSRYRVGELRVTGGEAIGEGVVRRFIRIGPGEFYQQSRLDDSQRDLFALDAVRFASIQPEAVSDSVVDIVVHITPASTRAARGGLGWSTDECFQTEARLTHRNLFGGAKRLSVRAQLGTLFAQQLEGAFPCSDVGQDPQFRTLNFLGEAELAIPTFFSGRNSVRARLYGERESVPDVFIREEVGADVSVTRRLRRRMTATIGYRPAFTGFDQRSAEIFFCVNFGFCTPDDIETVTQSRWLSPLTISWLYNRTNDPLQPTSGFYLAAEIERAERFTGSDYRYVRLTLQAADFSPLGRELVFGARVRMGLVEPTAGPFMVAGPQREEDVIHPSKRFFAGGSQSVRGFAQNLLGPRVLVLDQMEDCPNEILEPCAARLAAEDPGAFVERPIGGNASLELSLELRQVLSPRWGVVAFLDVGDVWRDLSEIDAPSLSPGLGLRFRSPVGPLRLDIGYNPSGPASLPVVFTLIDGDLLELPDPVVYDPFRFDQPSRLKEFWRRLQIHFSIGEAF